MTTGISSLPLASQQLRVDELASGRAPHCPGVEKSAPKADELVTSQRHWDVEGNEKPLH